MFQPDPRTLALPPAPDAPRVEDALLHQLALLGDGPEARAALLAQHHFAEWPAGAPETVDRAFEAAADAVVAGDEAALRALLAAHPSLARARSAYGHRATLLHHLAANGVEDARQRSPANAVAIARILLDAGAEPDAPCAAYGGRWSTTLALLLSSSHPAAAGVQADLVEVLCRGGAAPDGPADDGGPLWTAVIWGYTAAAERLVACGARVDHAVAAAALGDLARLDALLAAPTDRVAPGGAVFRAEHRLEHALAYAAAHGRVEVVRHLLARGPDLAVTEPCYGATALGMARYAHPAAGRPHGSPEVAALLEAA